MPKRKKRTATPRKKRDEKDDGLDVSESDSLDRPPSAKKVAPASSTCQLEDDVDQISSFTSVPLLNSTKSEGGEDAALSSHFWCNYCEFSADTKKELVTHMRQHMIKCSYCPFSSLSRSEVVRHCKYEHDKDLEVASSTVTQEVDSSSTDCDMDKDPCSACMFCDFMTYSTEHLEKHTASKHPGMIPKSVAKMITKQVSAQVRRDDALFYLSISNDKIAASASTQDSTSKSSSDSSKVESSSFIDLDAINEKAEDVKPEIKPSKAILEDVKMEKMPAPIKEQLAKDIISDILLQPREKSLREESSDKEASSTVSKVDRIVKVETMYCLTCPYSNVYVEKIKCHTLVQHPLGAAVATYSNMKDDSSSQDITFFCVREDCSHSGAERSAYQSHLMECCSHMETLTVLEKERLKSTFTFILDHQKKHSLKSEKGFLDFASSYLGLPLSESNDNFLDHGDRESSSHSSQTSETTPAKTITPQLNPNYQMESDFQPNQQTSGQSYQTYTDTQMTQRSNESLHNQGSAIEASRNNQFHMHSGLSNMPWSQLSNQNNQASSDLTSIPDYGQSAPGFNALSLQSSVQINGNQQPAFNHHVSQGSINPNSSTGHPNNYDANSHSIIQSSREQSLTMPTIPNNCFAPTSVDQPLNSSHNFGTSTSQTSSYQNRFDTTFSDKTTGALTAYTNSIEEQHPTPDTINTTGSHVSGPEKDSQPRVMNLISDSYSVLLSDGGASGLQDFSTPTESPQQPTFTPLISSQQHFVETQQSVSENFNNTQTHLSTQNQSLHSSGLVSQSTLDHSAQALELLQHNSVNILSGDQYSSQPSSSQQSAISNIYNSNPNFQSAQASSSFGALRNALGPEPTASGVQAPTVPNFLVTSSMHTQDAFLAQQTSVTAQSFLNAATSPMQAMQTMADVPATPPQNSIPGNPNAGASPLSPSIYLSGKAPSHRRTNWTATDMRPRGMPLPDIRQRGGLARMPTQQYQNSQASTAQIPQGHNVRQQLYPSLQTSTRGRGRGYSRPPRMSTGRFGMPQSRMPANSNADDDDVIVTAVVRGPQQQQMQPRQPLPGRYPGRGDAGPVARGQRQAPRFQSRARGQFLGSRYPPQIHPSSQPPKQFDISKHFEDLACVVNSNEEGGVDGKDNDEIQIVSVTPGKDKEKNQPKAVNASMFSFCCVHCGKDQGSRKVMKQHMKARHNDSLLGAFTNRETGQLLFFCPNLTCEFMTYDERRLSEHLHKCFDLDKSKPFDFGTAIKNLKSMKIRQMDVRTMGRSHDNPIDLDGQGMKDSFSTSLNAAFDEIVENASGRQIVRPATPPQAQPQVQPPLPTHSFQPHRGAIRGPIRHPYQGSPGTRQRFSGFQDQRLRAGSPYRQPRYQNPSVRGNMRPAGVSPRHPRMDMRNTRGMNPRMRAYNAGSHMAGPQPQFSNPPPPPQFSTPPRMPMGGQQEPIVIDLDADSPKGPGEREQDSAMVVHPPHGNTALPEQNLNVQQSSLPGDSTNTPSFNTFNNSSSHYMSTATFYTENSANSDSAQTDISTVSSEYMASRDNPDPQPQKSDSDMLGTNSSVQSDTNCNNGQPAVSEGSSFNQITSEYENHPSAMTLSHKTVTTHNTDSKAASRSIVSELLRNNIQVRAESDPKVLPPASVGDTPEMSSDACSVNRSAISDAPSTSALSSSDPATATPSTTLDNFDEEEKINAIVLEKVFAKVPNMPKNLSRRLVSKFKQYANYRGVKITPDSKVIDEFVSKISYKGSNTDKEATKAAQNPQPVSSATSEPKPASTGLESGDANSHMATDAPEVREETDTSKVPEETGTSEVPEETGTSEVPEETGTTEVQEETGTSELQGETGTSELQEKASTSEDSEETELPAQTESSSQSSDNEKGEEETTNSATRTASSPEVITMQVILAQRQLQFSGAFASIAAKASAAATEPVESNSYNSFNTSLPGKQQAIQSDIEQNLSSSNSAITEADVVASERGLLDHSARSKSVDISNNSQAACTIKRSSSFPLAISRTIRQTSSLSPTVECLSASHNSSISGSHGQYTNVSPPLQLPTSINNNNGSTFSSFSGGNGGTEVYIPSVENVLQHHSPLLGKDVFIQNDLHASFQAESEPETHSQADSVVSPTVAMESEKENHLEPDKDILTQEQVASSSIVSETVQSNQLIPFVPIVDSKIKESSLLSNLEPKEVFDKDAVTQDVEAVCGDVIDPDESATRTSSVSECEKQSSVEEDHSVHMPIETSNISVQLAPEVDLHLITKKDSAGEKKPLTPDLPEPVPEEQPSMIQSDVGYTVSIPKQEPIMIDSSVEHLVTGHEGLEVDIAGTPVENCLLPTKQEAAEEEDIKTTEEIETLSEMADEKDVASVLEEKKKTKKNGRQNLEMVDLTSGKLIFKVKKRRLSKKQSSKDEDEEVDELKEEKEEDPGEIKEEDEEELFVRRSERKRKPVHSDYKSVDTNEIDELMSDDDDEYNIDNDNDDYDTDSETGKRDESGLPLKKKAKKIKPPPDPTAFDLSTKGRFKCWLCKKIFSKCTFAKAHIIKKHIQGLCAIDVGQSEETGSVRMLVFCPRECRYATVDLEGLQKHSDSCEKPLLKENGEEYLTVNKDFLANKYSKLLETPLKTLLEPPKSTSSSGKPKKAKTSFKSGATKPSEMATVIIPHSEAIDPDCVVVPDIADQSENLSGSAPCADRSESSGSQAFTEVSVSNSNTDTVNSVTLTNVRPEQQGESSNLASNNFQSSFLTSSPSFPQPQHPTLEQHQPVQEPYNRVSEFQRHKMSQEDQITQSQQHQHQMFQQEQGPQQAFNQHQIKAPQRMTSQQQFESTPTRPPFATQNGRQPRYAPQTVRQPHPQQTVRQPHPQQRHMTSQNMHVNVRARPPQVRGNSVQMQNRRPNMNPSHPSMNPSHPRPQSSNVPLRHPQYRMSSPQHSFAGGSARHHNTHNSQINNTPSARPYQSGGNMSTGLPVNTARNQPGHSFVSNQPVSQFNNNQISHSQSMAQAQPYRRETQDEDIIMVDESGTICLD